MFKILQKTVSTGTVTANYPAEPAKISDRFRGRPSFDFDKWKDARPAAEVCSKFFKRRSAREQSPQTIRPTPLIPPIAFADVRASISKNGSSDVRESDRRS